MSLFTIVFAFQDTARQEKQAKERLSREKDVLIAEKFSLEQTLAVSKTCFFFTWKGYVCVCVFSSLRQNCVLFYQKWKNDNKIKQMNL